MKHIHNTLKFLSIISLFGIILLGILTFILYLLFENRILIIPATIGYLMSVYVSLSILWEKLE